MRLIDKDSLLKGSNHYLMRLDEDSIALGDIESIDVRFVEMAEEVKAIPISWIKNYASHKASKDLIDCYWHFWEDDVLKMVSEWEKENEIRTLE